MSGSSTATRLGLLCALTLAIVPAQQPPAGVERPPLTPIHSDGDYRFLVDPANHTDLWDALKYIRLGSASFLTLGAEYRIEHEVFHNENWGGPESGTNSYLLQRFMPHVRAQFGDKVRVFVSFQFDDVFGRAGGPRPVIDRDRADIHEAFVDLGGTGAVTARIGRQELVFGGGKLTTNNEGANVRLSFDAVRLALRHRNWRTELFASRPVRNLPGVFDNTPNNEQSFWGAYTTAPPAGSVLFDTYYFWLDTKQARYQRYVGREIRHSIGARLHTKKRGGGLDLDWEGLFQFGSLGTNRIRAWTVATETGYRWEPIPLRPRLAFNGDIASGDSNPTDRTLGTFNPLFPKGGYFAKMVLAGPYNFFDLHPLLELELRRNVTAQIDWDWFWRQSTRDGIYGIGGRLIRDGSASRARTIGSQGNVELRWSVDRHVTLSLSSSVFLPGRFLKDSGPKQTVLFLNYGFTYRF